MTFSKQFKLKQRGFSIVEVLVTVGIMGIMMAGMMTIQSSQNRDVKGLNEQLGKSELDRMLISTFADGSVCNFLFSNPADVGLSPADAKFDPSTLPNTNAFLLDNIPARAVAGTTPVVKSGVASATTTSSLIVKTISIDVTGPAGPNNYQANLVVAFEPANLVRALIPLTYPMILQTTGVGADTTVTGCQLTNGSGTANYLAMWQSAIRLTNSGIYQAPNGYIGIGTTVPGGALNVNGQIASSAYNNGGSLDFDFQRGNAQYSTSSCGASALTNMVDGGSYTIVIRGGTAATCSFTDVTGGRPFRYSPTNANTTAGRHTVYSMQVMGDIVYVSWISGF